MGGTWMPTGHSIWKISLPRSLNWILLLLETMSCEMVDGGVLEFGLVGFAVGFEVIEELIEVGGTLVEFLFHAFSRDQQI